MSRQYRLTILGLVLVGLLLIVDVPSLAQSTPTPTSNPQMQSIFEEDTCAPPCWFGIMPGFSTSADVEVMLNQFTSVFYWDKARSDNILDPITDYVTDGIYALSWQKYEQNTYFQRGTFITIKESVVQQINVESNQPFTLDQVLKVFGEPDDIYLTFRAAPYLLILIYSDPKLKVYLDAAQAKCQTSSILTDFTLDAITYYSPDAALKLSALGQPALYAVDEDTRKVALEIWDKWLEGKVDLECGEAWYTLPEVTPAPEATVEPAATEQP